jgi:hypothetical protein
MMVKAYQGTVYKLPWVGAFAEKRTGIDSNIITPDAKGRQGEVLAC